MSEMRTQEVSADGISLGEAVIKYDISEVCCAQAVEVRVRTFLVNAADLGFSVGPRTSQAPLSKDCPVSCSNHRARPKGHKHRFGIRICEGTYIERIPQAEGHIRPNHQVSCDHQLSHSRDSLSGTGGITL
jgi:hypothetical protein